MFQIEIADPDGGTRQLDVPDESMVGSRPENEVWLDSWRVSKDHARLVRTPSGVLLEDMGTFIGITVNGTRIATQHGPLKATDVIAIGPFKLRVTAMSRHRYRRRHRIHGQPARQRVTCEPPRRFKPRE
jgi:pilus assembly protein CpaF